MNAERVAIVANSLRVGGAERVAVNLANGFSRAGHSVDVVLVTESGPLLGELDESIRTVDLDSGRVLTSTPALRSYVTKNEPSAIISIGAHVNLTTCWAVLASRSAPVHIATEHSILKRMDESAKKFAMRTLMKAFYPRIDRVVAVSNGVVDDLRTVVGFDGEVDVIYNPIVSDALMEEAAQPVHHPWFTDDTPVVLSVGRLAPEKRVDTLIRAFASSRDELDSRLVIVGDGPERTTLERLVTRLDVDEHVEFLGFVENPYRYMAAADLFVLSSENEGFGMVLVEALSCGCPIVSTDCPSGPSEILDGGRYGRLVPVGEVQSMADAIVAELLHPRDEEVLVARSEEFSIERSVRQYESLIRSISDQR